MDEERLAVDQPMISFDHNSEHYEVQIWSDNRFVIWRRDPKGYILHKGEKWVGMFYVFKRDDPELFEALLNKTHLTTSQWLDILLQDRTLIEVVKKYMES